MPAEASLVQFRKISGDNSPAVVSLPVTATGQDAFAFFGSAGTSANQLTGYNSPPSSAAQFPVKAGGASWEVWITASFGGLGFQSITNIRLWWESFNFSGMGTTGTFLPSTGGPITVTGIHMRPSPGPLELGKDPSQVSNLMPGSAPHFGLPPADLSDGWLLFTTGPGASTTPDSKAAREALDLANEAFGRRHLSLDLAPSPFKEGGVRVRAIPTGGISRRYGVF